MIKFNFLKSILIVVFLIILLARNVSSQTTIVAWDFEDQDTLADAGISANLSKTIQRENSFINSFYYYTGAGGGKSLSAKNWDNGINTKYWIIELSTSTFSSVTLSSKQYSSDKAPRDFKVQYSLDTASANWIDVPNSALILASNYTSGVLSNLPLPAACDNQVSVFLRWIMTSNISADGTTVASGGNSRIDDIAISGMQQVNPPPVVLNAFSKNATTIKVIFNEPVNNTAENTANYTGLGTISSAIRSASKDTVTLTLSVPLANGVTETLCVNNIQDLAGMPMSSQQCFPVTFNYSGINDKIKIYFNQPVNNAVSSGVPAIYLNNCLADTLIAYINRTKYTLDVAVYNFSNNQVATAINNAFSRGVKIRWIFDGEQQNSALTLINPNIDTLGRPDADNKYMHNKFMIIDANSSNIDDPIVWTGSANWTNQSFNTDANNVIIIQDKNLAQAYTTEFNEMWGSTGLSPNPANSKFGSNKTDNTPHSFNVGGILIEQYFSPSDGTSSKIQHALCSANKDLYFGVYTFCEDQIADSIVKMIQQNSVFAAGILDPNSTSYCNNPPNPYSMLSPIMGDKLIVDILSGLYHNKMAIIDPTANNSDALVITGSHNWTGTADSDNDENTVIIHDATIANIYYQAFYRNFTDRGGTLPYANINNNTKNQTSLIIFPNPANEVLSIEYKVQSKFARCRVYDILGEEIISKTFSGSKTDIDVSRLAKGLYLLKVESGEGVEVRRFIKE